MRKATAMLGAGSMLAWGANAPLLAQAAAPPPPATASTQATPERPADPVQASEAAQALADIVVTAQFREQRLQDTPIAITAVNAATLQARSQTNLAQITAQAPSVTLRAQSAVFGPAIGANIRGIGQYDPSPAVEPGVGLYVDDVYYATLTGSVLDLLDLDRVEVLRGPQGTLAGRNSIGGAIKLYSKKPSATFGGYGEALYGIRDRIDLRGSVNVPLTDSLFARVSGVYKTQRGYVKRLDFGCVNPPGSALNPAVGGIAATRSGDCVVARDGDVDTKAVRGQLRFANGGPIEINLIGDYTRQSNGPAGEVLAFAGNAGPWIGGAGVTIPFDNRFRCGRFCNYANYFGAAGTWTGPVAPGYPVVETRANPRQLFDGWGVSGQINWKLSDDFALTSITAYRQYHSSFGNDNDLTPLPNSAQIVDLRFHAVTEEVRLNGRLADGLIDFTVGGFFLDQRTINAAFLDLRFTPFPLQFQQRDPVDASTQAGFAQATLNLTDKLKLTGGLRYSHERKSYAFVRRNRDGTLNPFVNPVGNPIDGLRDTYRGNRVDWRANVQYNFTPDVMAYAQASTGFKGGGVSPRPFNRFQVVPFSPETVTSYEAGLKTDLFDRKVRLNLAGYYSDYRRIQLTLLNCPQFSDPTTTADDNGPCQVTANAGNAHIKGLEAETTIRPFAGLTIDGSASYTDFKFTSINPLAGGPTNPSGPQLNDVAPYTPKWKWSFGIQYEADLGQRGTITPRIDGAYQSTAFSNPTNSPYERIPGYTLFNARLTWRNQRRDLQVAAEVTNLFDKYYFYTVFDNTPSAGYATRQPGRPREWAVSVRKSF